MIVQLIKCAKKDFKRKKSGFFENFEDLPFPYPIDHILNNFEKIHFLKIFICGFGQNRRRRNFYGCRNFEIMLETIRSSGLNLPPITLRKFAWCPENVKESTFTKNCC